MKFPFDCNLLQQKPPAVKITGPCSLASHCYSHRWLMVGNWLLHWVNMAVRVTLCSFRCRASRKLATVVSAFHRYLLSKAKGHPTLLNLL